MKDWLSRKLKTLIFQIFCVIFPDSYRFYLFSGMWKHWSFIDERYNYSINCFIIITGKVRLLWVMLILSLDWVSFLFFNYTLKKQILFIKCKYLVNLSISTISNYLNKFKYSSRILKQVLKALIYLKDQTIFYNYESKLQLLFWTWFLPKTPIF